MVVDCGASGVVNAGWTNSVSRWAHFQRSMEMRSVRLPRSTLKCLSVREITLKGPSYGGCNGLRTASRRMKT